MEMLVGEQEQDGFALLLRPAREEKPDQPVSKQPMEGLISLLLAQVSAGYLVLKPGALREPHWHPTHWEVDYAIEERGELGIVIPDDQQNISRLEPGDIGFIPAGWTRYIRNVRNTDMIWILVFTTRLPT